MLAKRIIPCLDVKDGRTVKGVRFQGLRDVGDPVELAEAYSREGCDELVFLDITATKEKRKTLLGLVERVAQRINIPFTVGGGISTIQDVKDLLSAGADKISINSRAVENPEIIDSVSDRFGSQCIVVAVDSRRVNDRDWVYIHAGHTRTDKETIAWVAEIQKRGGGEILVTSMDHDGTRDGFASSLTRRISDSCRLPVIASGGAGSVTHFEEVLTAGGADAALAASVFHYGVIAIPDLKEYLKGKGIPIRL